MSNKPHKKLCRVCHTLIPLIEWPDHSSMEKNQIEMFPDTITKGKPKITI